MAGQVLLLHYFHYIRALDRDGKRISSRQTVDILASDIFCLLRTFAFLADVTSSTPISVLARGLGSGSRKSAKPASPSDVGSAGEIIDLIDSIEM